MRGGYVHTTVLLDPLTARCRERGIPYGEEVPVGPGRDAGHVDLLIGNGVFRTAVEAECSPRRAVSDVVKARLLRVQELWIVVPSPAVRRGVERALAQERQDRERSTGIRSVSAPHDRPVLREAGIGEEAGGDVRVFVLSVFQARARLERVLGLFSIDFRGEGSG